MNKFSLNKGWLVLCYSLILGLCLCHSPSFAQNVPLSTTSKQQVTGTITDGTAPLTGVSISVKGQQNTVVSDFDGKFSITASSHDILIFTYVGFRTVTIPVEGRTVINTKMQEDATALQEVKINAGYYSVKESERTGSIARITSKDIEKQPVTNVLASMQGRMAGVNITQETGVPGGGFNINIRGINSLRANGNAPLYVIDGVPYSSDEIGSAQTSTVLPTSTSPLSNINPTDIESIEVLKDADATSIYGSRGANGVVLITTKKGKSGKTKFSASISSGTGQVTRFMNLMNTEQYLKMRRQAFANDGITTYPSYAYDVNGTWDQNRYTNWQKKLIGGTASITNAQLSVSGGNEQTQFLVGGNFNSETTVFPGDFIYKKATMHASLNHQSENKRFRINFSVNYTKQKNDQPWTDLTHDAIFLAPNAPALYDSSGNLNWENGTFNNPLRNLEGKYLTDSSDLIANTVISYDIVENLELKSNFGFTNLGFTESSTLPSTMYNPSYGIGSESSILFLNNTNRQSWIAEPQLKWKKIISEGKFEILVGSTFQSQKNVRIVQKGTGFTSNSLIYNLAAAKNNLVFADEETIYKYQAFFARLNFNWQEKYIINLTGRRDGSSRFGPGNQFANFGAIGAAWLFSNETWIKERLPFLSFGKLRGSYGTTGSDQIGDYMFLDTYSTSGTIYEGTTGLTPTRLYNPNFGWEINKKLEIALETGFVNDRIFLTAAWYRNRSSNQLVGIPLPGTTGFPTLQANLGATVQNTGIELTLQTKNIQKENFNWSTNINLTVARNKLLSFPGLENSTYSNQYSIGESVNIKRLYQSTGVNPQTGIYGFVDFDGDGIITAQGDKKIIRDFTPKYYGGIQNSFSYYGIKLDFLFQFVKQQNYNYTQILGIPGGPVNMAAEVSNSWTQVGDITPYQQYTTGINSEALDAYYRYVESDKGVSDASFIRLKNVALTYELPKSWTKNIVCCISVQGQNLMTFTSYKGADPEFTTGGYIPPLRVITTGLQLIF